MSEGNAWALMKAREIERERLRKLGVDVKDDEIELPRPVSASSRPRKFSGLDYDQTLAVPMPKPPIRSSRYEDEKRPVPVPVKLPDNDADKKVEKKRSKVAAIKSKLSLKELTKELLRSTEPPHSGMPSIPPGLSILPGKTAQTPNDSFNFEKEGLYVPKPRQQGMHPASAPAATTKFREAAGLGIGSLKSVPSSPGQQTPPDKRKKEHAKEPLERADTPKASNMKLGSVEPMVRLDTVLIDGSSPLASTGDTQRGHPTLVDAKQRVSSLKADDGSSSLSESTLTPTSASHAPIMCEAPGGHDEKPQLTSREHKESKNENTQPLIVSSDKLKHPSASTQARCYSTAAAFDPTQTRGSVSPHAPMSEPNVFAGTSHESYVPPAPIPNYRNSVTLEEQIATYMDSIHLHVDAMANRLAGSFENSNSWTADQIIKHVGDLSDSTRSLHGRTACQLELVKDIHKDVLDIHKNMLEIMVVVKAMQRENRQAEDRLAELFRHELHRVKTELSTLASTVRTNLPCKPVADTRSTNRLQGSRDGIRRHGQGAYRKKALISLDKEMTTKETENNGGGKEGEHNQASEFISQRNVNENVEESTVSNVPSPAAPFRAPFVVDNKHSSAQHEKDIQRNPVNIPTSDLELTSSAAQPKPADTIEDSTQKTETADKNEPDNMKFHLKKTVLNAFRRNRGNSDNDRKRVNERNQSSNTPSMQAVARNIALSRLDGDPNDPNDPSNIHPALRTPLQRQIVIERERERERIAARSEEAENLMRADEELRQELNNPPQHQDLLKGHRASPAPPVDTAPHAGPSKIPLGHAQSSQQGNAPSNAHQAPVAPNEVGEITMDRWYREVIEKQERDLKGKKRA
ncbi:hypothetical protein BDV25DRAFT_135645 [Aspergillus avenaceus]|uniref:Uncharacterized protein n=1 Tax=Aspergillus avenaceus TaxID=36643 RepID=A0A5N6U808_ASPAV|nr:hypothetical protein BDV25DRAFT_135645 [Aspergillus avenaceus]